MAITVALFQCPFQSQNTLLVRDEVYILNLIMQASIMRLLETRGIENDRDKLDMRSAIGNTLDIFILSKEVTIATNIFVWNIVLALC